MESVDDNMLAAVPGVLRDTAGPMFYRAVGVQSVPGVEGLNDEDFHRLNVL